MTLERHGRLDATPAISRPLAAMALEVKDPVTQLDEVDKSAGQPVLLLPRPAAKRLRRASSAAPEPMGDVHSAADEPGRTDADAACAQPLMMAQPSMQQMQGVAPATLPLPHQPTAAAHAAGPVSAAEALRSSRRAASGGDGGSSVPSTLAATAAAAVGKSPAAARRRHQQQNRGRAAAAASGLVGNAAAASGRNFPAATSGSARSAEASVTLRQQVTSVADQLKEAGGHFFVALNILESIAPALSSLGQAQEEAKAARAAEKEAEAWAAEAEAWAAEAEARAEAAEARAAEAEARAAEAEARSVEAEAYLNLPGEGRRTAGEAQTAAGGQ